MRVSYIDVQSSMPMADRLYSRIYLQWIAFVYDKVIIVSELIL